MLNKEALRERFTKSFFQFQDLSEREQVPRLITLLLKEYLYDQSCLNRKKQVLERSLSCDAWDMIAAATPSRDAMQARDNEVRNG